MDCRYCRRPLPTKPDSESVEFTIRNGSGQLVTVYKVVGEPVDRCPTCGAPSEAQQRAAVRPFGMSRQLG